MSTMKPVVGRSNVERLVVRLAVASDLEPLGVSGCENPSTGIPRKYWINLQSRLRALVASRHPQHAARRVIHRVRRHRRVGSSQRLLIDVVGVDQTGIVGVALEQFVVASVIDDAPLIEVVDLVSEPNGRLLVRHQNHRGGSRGPAHRS